jgi:uncharacterized protein YndB with AHSA1/START domain
VAVVLCCNGVRAQDPGSVEHEGIVEAPLGDVWAAWTTDEGLRAWLAPHADIELQVGGQLRANYAAAGVLGDAQTIEHTILAFEPQRMLSIRVSAAPHDFPFPNAIADMWTVIYFEPSGPDRTQVRIVSLGFGADEESQAMRAFFEHGNAATLAQLQRLFATASASP